MKIFTTIDDYVTAVVAPALENHPGHVTREQMLTIAHAMTTWHDEYTPAGDIDLNRTGYIERPDADFWAITWDILTD